MSELLISNIFLQIKDITFDTYKSEYIGDISKQLLRNAILLQYTEFCEKLKPQLDCMDANFYDSYPHIRHIDINDNPLEHCIINNLIYPKTGTNFLNYYNRGIIDYLKNIGFTSNLDKLKN